MREPAIVRCVSTPANLLLSERYYFADMRHAQQPGVSVIRRRRRGDPLVSRRTDTLFIVRGYRANPCRMKLCTL